MPRKIAFDTIPAEQVMKTLGRIEHNPEGVPDLVKNALRKAEAIPPGDRVTIILPKVQVLDNQESGFFSDQAAEIYVVGLALDLSGEGASLEQAPEIFRNVSRTASAPLIVSSTPLFNNIYDGDNLPLLGNGIVLYGPKDPGGLLDIHVAIMEDDGGYRHLGEMIEKAAKEVRLPDLLEGALQAASVAKPEVFLLKNTFRLLFHTLVTFLMNNHDDVVQDFHFSALRHQRYLPGIHPFAYRGAEGYIKVDVQKG